MTSICHINLARGFRGGERQTELLIKELSRYDDLQQTLVVRPDSPLRKRFSECPGLQIQPIRKPYAAHVRKAGQCQMMHVHEARAGYLAWAASKLSGSAYVITRRVPNPIGTNPLTRSVYGRASRVVALSHAIQEILVGYQPSLPVSVIPSMTSQLPVDQSHLAQLRKTYAGRFIVGHAGALVNHHKGQQYLIHAAEMLRDKYPKMLFLFLGSGRDEQWLRNLAKDLDNVEFLGFQENIGDYLSLFDVFAFPSQHEGLGSVLLDAMAFGLPIVASGVDGIRDIIEPGMNGLLVPPRDAGALAACLETLYKDEDLRNSLSQQALKESERYSPEKIASQYMELYREVLAKELPPQNRTRNTPEK